jgi:hypothetical protein
MQIIPYKSVGELRFGIAKDQCLKLLGDPNTIRFNRKGFEELEYNGLIVRIDPASHKVCEFTLLPLTNGNIDGIEITWDKDFLAKACKIDGSALDIYGFIVLRKLGIAVTGIHDDDRTQLAITVFSEGAFDKLLARGYPFNMDC